MKNSKKTKVSKHDLPESADDKKHLQPDEGILNLPDVKDIPGQEHVRPLPAREMADSTISSADEEGPKELNLEDNETDIDPTSTNVSDTERELLQETSESMATSDDIKLRQSKVDNVDEDGELLNEEVNASGSDLDVPGSEDDDANEEIGEEDEENNSYSLRDEKEDQNQGKM